MIDSHNKERLKEAQSALITTSLYCTVSAVIFVIDSHNKERLKEAQSALIKLVQEKELKDASLLIYANKQV